MWKLLAALAAALCVATPADARPYTVDDLLHQASFGRKAFDPTGRWIVFEQHDPYDALDRYDHNLAATTALSRLRIAGVSAGGRARPLLAGDPRGVVMGPFSPDGERLAVYRWRGDTWSLGVVELATGAVRWFAVTPEAPVYGRTVQWRSPDELLVIDRADGSLPWPLRSGRLSAERLPPLWARQARGQAAVTVQRSGARMGQRSGHRDLRLLRIRARAGGVEVLASGAFRDLEISPDGRRVALLETGADLQPRPGGASQGPAGISTEAHNLRILDLRTGTLRAPTSAADLLPHLMSWSPSGRALLVFARGADGLWPSGRLLKIHAATSRLAVVGEGLSPALHLRPENIGTGWMGETPLLKARRPGGHRDDWWRLAPGAPINLTRDLQTPPVFLRAIGADGAAAIIGEQAFRISPHGKVSPLPGRFAAWRDPATTQEGRIEGPAPPGSWVVQRAPGATWMRWMTPAGPMGAIKLPADLAPARIAAANRATSAAAFDVVTPTGGGRLQLQSGDRTTELAEINARLADVDWPRAIAVPHLGPSGQALTSWLFLPAHPLGSPPPLVVKVYSGMSYRGAPKDSPLDRGFVANINMLTGHGYAVLTPSLPLPQGTQDPMLGLADRVLAVVDAASNLPAAHGAFDPDRLALIGHSYGGYTTMSAITQTQRFRAAVSVAGISNLFTQWEALPALHRSVPEVGLRFNWSTGYTEASQGGMGGPPWTDPMRYVRNSPVFAADRATTPLLLMHGDQDIVQLAQSEAMFSALFRQAKDAELVTYWGEGHSITSPGNVRDMYARIFDFLDERLARPRLGAHGPDAGP